MGASNTQKLVKIHNKSLSSYLKTVFLYFAKLSAHHSQTCFLLNMKNCKIKIIVKILNIYILLSCTHLYHFFPLAIHYLQCFHCLLHRTLEIFNRQITSKYEQHARYWLKTMVILLVIMTLYRKSTQIVLISDPKMLPIQCMN